MTTFVSVWKGVVCEKVMVVAWPFKKSHSRDRVGG